MAKKSKMSCDDELGQISLEESMGNQNTSQLLLREPTDINSLKRKEKSFELPENVKKNYSEILSEVLCISQSEAGEDEAVSLIEIEEVIFEKIPIKSKVFLTYNESLVDGKLTNFDKEVIDAVATLAPYTSQMSATTIFRVITGKIKGQVTKEQREKVHKSMMKCQQYSVNIDLTSEFLELIPSEKGNTSSMTFFGSILSFNGMKKKANNGSNFFYNILEMPPLFKVAEVIGKISIFELDLLDTPISKTDQAITVQGYLLKEIDSMKRKNRNNNFIFLQEVYKLAEVDISEARYVKSRIREQVKKILNYWKEKDFISDFKEVIYQDEKIIEVFWD